MAFKPPIAVFDACVLYPFHLRNVLIQCAFDGLVDARWTDDIHAEWIRSLAASSPDTPISRLEATRERMKAVLPDADITDYQALIPSLCLPDIDDRHVSLPAWRELPDEMMFCLAWLYADQVTRVIAPVGYRPKDLDRWLAHHTQVSFVGFDQIRQVKGWIQHFVLGAGATSILSGFVAELLLNGATVPHGLMSMIGRVDESGLIIPLPEVAAARLRPTENYWMIQDAVPVLVEAGWIKEDSPFAMRTASDILQAILDEAATGDPTIYAPVIAMLVPIDLVDNQQLLDRLALRVSETLASGLISEGDVTFTAFLELAAEVHAQRRTPNGFEEIVVKLAALFAKRWPHDRVRLDDSESGRAAAKLLNACYLFGAMGGERLLVDRIKDVTGIFRAFADAWPGVRIAVLSMLDLLASQVDSGIACEAIWPVALELRSR